MSHKKSSPTNNLLPLLLRPQFVVFSLSVIFSQIAANMLSIVLIVLTYNLTHSNFAVSILVMTFLLPQVFFSFLGGIIADAKNKRKILLFGNIARALVLVLFFFVKDTLAFIYLFMLIIAVLTQFYIPAEAPLIPHLVRRQQLLAANAIFGVCLFGSILVGYVVAGPAMRIFGSSGVFLFMAGLFALAFLCVQLMPDVAPSVRKLRTKKTMTANAFHLYHLVWKEFRDVLKILNDKKNVASSLLFLALSQVIILVLATVVPDYAQKTLHIPSEDISLVIFAPAALGMLLSSLLIGSRFTKNSHEKLISVGIFLSSIVLFLFAAIDLQNYFNLVALSIVITFIAGIANACIFIPAQTIVQSHVGNKSLSKVFGLLYLAVAILAFAPIIMTGVFADVLGVRAVLLGIGIMLLSLGFVKFYFNRKNKTLISALQAKKLL
ncbi:MAG: MFS transporter [Candidatus Levybacteria bacterium]|nr:MFS transporter [Candidatus Levybacteria bacterium]